MSVTVETQGHAAVVTLRWPERRNALGPTQASEVAEAIARAGSLPDVSAVVLTGEGSFCAGGDLPSILDAIEGAAPADVQQIVYGRFQQIARALRDNPLPTIAAVDGAAIGLGLDLTLWCDRRYAAKEAKFGQGWARMGLVPGTGGAALLEGLSPGLLWELLGTSGELSVERAEAAGIVTLCENPLEDAIEYAAKLSRIGVDALRGYVELTRRGLPDDTYLARCAEIQSHRLTSEDFAARVKKSGLSRPTVGAADTVGTVSR